MQFLETSDFEKIETTLNIELPLHYKKFHLERHDLLERLNKAQLELDENMHLYTNVDCLIDDNKMFAVPKNKMIIGQDGGGGYFFMDITPNTTDERVYTIPHDSFDEDEIFDKETNDYKWDNDECQAADNLVHYVTKYCSWLEEVNGGI